MMRYLLRIIFLCILYTVSTMMYAQDDPNATRTGEAPPQIEYPTTGVRFVICTTTKAKLPVPLYAEYKDNYVPLHISARGTSERAVVKNGHVVLYENKPVKGVGKAGETEEEPFLDIPVPAEIGNSKAICLVLTAGGKSKPSYYFMKESDFPMGGFYVINFSASPLEFLYTLTTGDVSTKRRLLSPFKRPENNCLKPDGENVSVVMLGENSKVENVDFMVRVPAEAEGGTPMSIRSARLTLKSYSSCILLVVRHPRDPQHFSVISVTYNNALEKRQKYYRENVMKDSGK